MLTRLIPLVIATFAVGTDNFVIAGLLPGIAKDLDVSISAAGQLVTVFALTFAISASVLGALTSGLDRRRALMIALGIFVVGNLATAVAPDYATVMAARVVSALGAGMITSSASATATALAPPERRGWVMSIVLGGLSVATALGLPLGTLLGGIGWRWTLLAVSALGLVALIGVFLLLGPVYLPAADLSARLRPLRDPGILMILATTVVALAGTYLFYTYIAAAFRPLTHGSVQQLTVLLFAYGVGDVIGTLASGKLGDRWGPRPVALGSLVASALVLAVQPLLVRDFSAGLIWALTWGVCSAACIVPQQHRLIEKAPASAPILLGLSSTAIYLGISLGSGLGGLTSEWISPDQFGYPAAVLTAAATVLVLVTKDRQRVPVFSSADKEMT
ncbi:MFS transporter [Streptomyces sp. NPDC056061]|uniref:MFS transporter n=1 Tax=Streptomyces sp. NPDC056061 TaxID=3345700 RepID=UPI0035D89CCE